MSHRTTRTRLTALLVSGALVGGTSLALAPAASAAYTDCAVGTACVWTGYDYTGSRGWFENYYVMSSTWKNKVISIANNGRASVAYFYDNADYTGRVVTLNNPARGGQSRDPNLANGTDASPMPFHTNIEAARFIAD